MTDHSENFNRKSSIILDDADNDVLAEAAKISRQARTGIAYHVLNPARLAAIKFLRQRRTVHVRTVGDLIHVWRNWGLK